MTHDTFMRSYDSQVSKDFSCLKECSPQQIRFVLGSLVQQQIFLSTLPLPLEDIKNNAALGDFFQAQLLSFRVILIAGV